MRSQTSLVLIIAGVLFGCGSGSDNSTRSDAQSSGGAGGGAPMTGGSSASSSDNLGGASQTSSGGVTSLGGAIGGGNASGGKVQTSGGAGLGGAGTAGSTTESPAGAGHTDTTSCPEWPQSKATPDVGLYFYGPHPGPCSSTSTTNSGSLIKTTYSYANGQIVSATSPTQTTAYTWESGVIASYLLTVASGGTATAQYTWSPGALTITTSIGVSQKMDFGPGGYPIDLWTTNLTSSYLLYKYDYVDCRLVRRVGYTATGTIDATTTVTYEYDGAGNIVAQRRSNGVATTYDYTCW